MTQMTKKNQLFKWQNLSDFEKNLFLKNQIKTLKKELSIKNIEIGKLTVELEHVNYENKESTKIKNLKTNIKGLNNRIVKLKRQHHDMLFKISNKKISSHEFRKEQQYWKQRCLLAEKYIEESPCDPYINQEQNKAYLAWIDFKIN